jgi:uncharacterized protein (DUF1810 family)
MNDLFSLRRFETAQDEGRTYELAVAELRAGRKTSHWMWFVFPRISGLGRSSMSRTYAISSLAEAKAYLERPVLASRLIECTGILAELRPYDLPVAHALDTTASRDRVDQTQPVLSLRDELMTHRTA